MRLSADALRRFGRAPRVRDGRRSRCVALPAADHAAGRGGPAVALVDDALDWLARHQEPDGHWSAAGWRARCTQGAACAAPSALAFDDGLAAFDAGVTALGALAFLGHGHAPQGGGAHAAAVDSALTWLVARQAPDGSIGLDAPGDGFGALEHGLDSQGTFSARPTTGWALYNHAVATTALCEGGAMGADPARWRAPAERALAYTLSTQNPRLGWEYGDRTGRNNSSMTLWMAQALRAARDAGLAVPQGSVDGAFEWLARATDAEGNTGYDAPGGGPSAFRQGGGVGRGDDHALSAGRSFVRVLLGDKLPPRDLNAVVKRLLAARPGVGGEASRTAFMHLYYGASFLALRPATRDTREWRSAQVDVLLAAARRDGCARGSFEPTEVWCLAGGRVYATALGAMALEAPWRLGGVAPTRGR